MSFSAYYSSPDLSGMAPASPNFFVHGRGLTTSTARKGAPRILEALATHLAHMHVLTSPFSVLIVGRRLQ